MQELNRHASLVSFLGLTHSNDETILNPHLTPCSSTCHSPLSPPWTRQGSHDTIQIV